MIKEYVLKHYLKLYTTVHCCTLKYTRLNTVHNIALLSTPLHLKMIISLDSNFLVYQFLIKYQPSGCQAKGIKKSGFKIRKKEENGFSKNLFEFYVVLPIFCVILRVY